MTHTSTPATAPSASVALPKHILVGYWHNWQAEATRFIRLRDVPESFDVVNVAFATSKGGSIGLMDFRPCGGVSADEFKLDMLYLHQQGKKIVVSAGGAKGSGEIGNAEAEQNFVDSMSAIILEYGFDGIDINLEGGVFLEEGDTDFRNPISPSITHLVAAIRKIHARFQPDFIVSMAPETVCVQGGYEKYGGVWGSYLPVIDGLRDILTYLHVQHYNSGARLALDGQTYAQGTADFHVAMAEMLLDGFPVNRNERAIFPMLRPEQIAIGLPARAGAAEAGYTTPEEIRKVLIYLATGRPFGGNYRLRYSAGYPDFRGLMTWSINWDATRSHQFSRETRSLLDGLG